MSVFTKENLSTPIMLDPSGSKRNEMQIWSEDVKDFERGIELLSDFRAVILVQGLMILKHTVILAVESLATRI